MMKFSMLALASVAAAEDNFPEPVGFPEPAGSGSPEPACTNGDFDLGQVQCENPFELAEWWQFFKNLEKYRQRQCCGSQCCTLTCQENGKWKEEWNLCCVDLVIQAGGHDGVTYEIRAVSVDSIYEYLKYELERAFEAIKQWLERLGQSFEEWLNNIWQDEWCTWPFVTPEFVQKWNLPCVTIQPVGDVSAGGDDSPGSSGSGFPLADWIGEQLNNLDIDIGSALRDHFGDRIEHVGDRIENIIGELKDRYEECKGNEDQIFQDTNPLAVCEAYQTFKYPGETKPILKPECYPAKQTSIMAAPSTAGGDA